VTLAGGLQTPATCVIAERLHKNLERMQSFADSAGFGLRPHAKTHKCTEIARMQIRLGSHGLSVATVGEAEALGGGAIDDLFVCFPIWADQDLVSRLGALTDTLRICIGADSAESVMRLRSLKGRLGISVEIDCGLRRTGVQPAAALGVARAAREVGLTVEGVFTFPGHSYAPGMQDEAAADEAAALEEAAAVMLQDGFGPLVRSGGSTPSARRAHPRTVDELRPGVYVFNDAQQIELGVAGFDDIALVVVATVVSRPEPGRIVLDAGSKVLGQDRPSWATGHGRLLDYPDARIRGLWEHHAVVELNGPGTIRLGDLVAVVPNHVCTAVNLVSELLVVEAASVVDRWAVRARGGHDHR
jgi:D-serine deaminase-like pyridoxal phosphate-dependent protein